MKESITKFDLASAFKALDDLDIPTTKNGVKPNRPALTEIFSRKTKFDALLEEYYDISNTQELSDAKDAREAEIAKAKLARIEKIVDLDAESPEDLLTSYVGKLIIQCPQCMTLFYKNKEDIEESEEDTSTVNVSEVCQHCGNDSGYTLIGKVGEATAGEFGEETFESPEDGSEETFDLEEIPSEDGSENAEADSDESEEPIDLEGDLEELDLDVVDDETSEEEEDEKKEESFSINTEGRHLLEQLDLEEDADLDISDSEFEALINSPEFKKPISDSAVRAMLNTEGNNKSEAVVPAKSQDVDTLEEGVFDKIKDKLSNAVDKATGAIKSREAKADWILKHALENYDSVQIDNKGDLAPEVKNQRFKTFLCIGFKNIYSNGNKITMVPAPDNENLIIAKEIIAEKYINADKWARGWSQDSANGPAFIYLAKDENDDNAVFVCEYFGGELKHDQVDRYFEKIQKNLRGAKLRDKSKVTDVNRQDETEEQAKKAAKETPVSSVKRGAKIQLGEQTCEVIEVKQGKSSNIILKIKYENGKSDSLTMKAKAKVKVLSESLKDDKTKLGMLMQYLEDVQESSLEALISESLIETYQNVAGYKLTGCSYLNEKFEVSGTIYFTSGRTRKASYVFTEAYKNKGGKIEMHGTNEKLGPDRQFTLEGYINRTNKSLITESFKQIKK